MTNRYKYTIQPSFPNIDNEKLLQLLNDITDEYIIYGNVYLDLETTTIQKEKVIEND